jgi:hypothetical protein
MVTFPRYTPQIGDWYYGGICPMCGIRVPFTFDPYDGGDPEEDEEPIELMGWVLLTCDQGHEHRYQASKFQRRQYRGQPSE